MSIEKVRAYFQTLGIADRIREFSVSSATVDLAALAVGVEGARIAKSLSFKVQEKPIIVVVAGDAKVDNTRYKAQFHTKAKSASPCCSSRSAAVKGLSAPQARLQRPMRFTTRTRIPPRS